VEEKPVNATHRLQDLGQSLWLDNITRDLLTTNTLKRYIYDNLWITGLTSNPTIFDHAISHRTSYDDDIRRLAARDMPTEALFFELALEDLTRAADLFEPVHERTAGVDGWVSLEVSPLLAHHPRTRKRDRTLSEARQHVDPALSRIARSASAKGWMADVVRDSASREM
jgi:transaldolase